MTKKEKKLIAFLKIEKGCWKIKLKLKKAKKGELKILDFLVSLTSRSMEKYAKFV